MGGELSYADIALYLRRYSPAQEGQHMSATLYRHIFSFHDLGFLANFAKKDRHAKHDDDEHFSA